MILSGDTITPCLFVMTDVITLDGIITYTHVIIGELLDGFFFKCGVDIMPLEAYLTSYFLIFCSQ
jgi:hypothetical protein